MHTRSRIRDDLAALGIAPGDIVLAHAAISRIGPLLGGPDTLIAALRDAVEPGGTIMAYTDWDAGYEDLLDAHGRVPDAWRTHVPPFDPATSRSVRDNGVLAEFLRTTPGALRSGSPGPSMAAIGARAEWLTTDHPIDYGYGPGSPLAKLVEAGGKVALVGAPLYTMTLLHHAEHLARVSGKRIKRVEVPFAKDGAVEWRMVEEFETAEPIVAGLADDYFVTIVEDFLTTGAGKQGLVGDAPSVAVDAAAITAFAVDWIERHAPPT